MIMKIMMMMVIIMITFDQIVILINKIPISNLENSPVCHPSDEPVKNSFLDYLVIVCSFHGFGYPDAYITVLPLTGMDCVITINRTAHAAGAWSGSR